MISQIKQDLQKLANPEQAKILQRFFKTGKGEYGEGDVFLGIKVPEQRKVAKKHLDISLSELQELVQSKYHEHRLTGFMMIEYKFQKAEKKNDKKEQEELYDFFIKNKEYANNWDIIDVTTPKVVGKYLFDKDRAILYKLAKSKSIWDRRIAVLATFWFIYKNDFFDSIKIAEILVDDKHDLIHKAVGWMLREVGKRDQAVEEKFLDRHYKTMPRMMLRYALERLPEDRRKHYMGK